MRKGLLRQSFFVFEKRNATRLGRVLHFLGGDADEKVIGLEYNQFTFRRKQIMDEIKVVLADGTEVAIDEFIYPLHLVKTGNREELEAIWDCFTREALKKVTITVDGLAAVVNTDVELDGVQFVGGSGEMTAHFYMHGGLEVGGDAAALEEENADMKAALEILGVTEETEVE